MGEVIQFGPRKTAPPAVSVEPDASGCFVVNCIGRVQLGEDQIQIVSNISVLVAESEQIAIHLGSAQFEKAHPGAQLDMGEAVQVDPDVLVETLRQLRAGAQPY